jgi:hypothetical protein
VVLSLAGAWLGHTIQYAIGHGTAGMGPMLSGSAHLYLVPAGAVLASIVFVASVGWARALAAAHQRLTGVRAALTGQSRRAIPDLTPDWSQEAGPEPVGFQPLRFWLMLAGSQIALYVFQENTEASRVHIPLPGLSVLTGLHWTAIPVHLLVAVVLVAAIRLCQVKTERVTTSLAREIERLRHRLRAALAGVAVAPPTLLMAITPLQRWGRQRWERPPPVRFAVAPLT